MPRHQPTIRQQHLGNLDDSLIYLPRFRGISPDEEPAGVVQEEKDAAKAWVEHQPSHYGEMFFDRKSNYSLNSQITILPHNFKIVDYGLGHMGSTHDSSAF
ncbi:hypothetical protein SERLA73DRAFT_159462 [Serpula lacrymans var. lacrymans S7.3]|uniref:Uncharacterized protein n=1 Tax=Serpula lacrymans var. lacrymans (strain S7.3) TaxID=936435 RepID=F8PSN4_SERL3|nr:hypothetical protein SERLA73DRAFT_159462 [Serpula lacrymans var. lacrymans S7.3]